MTTKTKQNSKISKISESSKSSNKSISKFLYIAGTVILVAMIGICAYNFAKDARTFQLSMLFPSTASKTDSGSADKSADSYSTLKYNKDSNDAGSNGSGVSGGSSGSTSKDSNSASATSTKSTASPTPTTATVIPTGEP